MLVWLGITMLSMAQSEPEIIVPFQSEWLIWTGQNTPPNWPNKPTVRSATAIQYSPTRQGDHRIDLTCPTKSHSCDGGYRTVDVWLSGLKAPFLAIPEKSVDALSTYRARQFWANRKSKGPFTPTTLIHYGVTEEVPENGLNQFYLANEFYLADATPIKGLQLNLIAQQGALIYLNGHEVGRRNILPGGERHGAYAKLPTAVYEQDTKIGQLDLQHYLIRDIPPKYLRSGQNTLSLVIKKGPNGGFPALYADAELVSHSEFRFLKQPYVQQLKPNSFMVSFESSTPCHGAIELKSPSNRQTQVHSGQKQASFQHILVEGLSDNTPVSYRVRCMTDEDVPLYSDWYTVTTASTEAEDFSFILYGDSRSGHTKHQEVVEQIKLATQEAPARFLIHTGDMVTNGYEEWRWQEKFFEPVGDLLAQLPIFSAPGNHELNQHQYFDYFPPFYENSYYRFQFGQVEFFSLNTNIDYTPGSPQYIWLESVLERSTAPWKLAFFHHPPYSCATMRKPGDLNVRQHIVPLLEKYGVQLALLGHDHLYGKTKVINGVQYLTSGGGGSWLYDGRTDSNNVHCSKAYHFVQFWVTDTEITWKAIDQNGTLLDQDQLLKQSFDE